MNRSLGPYQTAKAAILIRFSPNLRQNRICPALSSLFGLIFYELELPGVFSQRKLTEF